MLMTTYLSEAFGGALFLLTLPVLLELAVLTLASRLPRRSGLSSSFDPGIQLAVIIPAHNEEILIASCIESLRVSASGTKTRIIAVAHNCSDRTAQRAAEAGAEVLVYDDPEAQGKGAALAFGFAYASSQGMDASLVVDADSAVSTNLVPIVRDAIASGTDVAQCRYEMESSSNRPTTRLTALAFRGFNVIRPIGRSRLGLSAGVQGNGFAVRQALLAEGSYNSHSVVEDLEFHIRLVLAGHRVQFLEDAKVCSALPASKSGETTQRARWEGGRANAARTWLPLLLGQLVRGRFGSFEPMLDLASLPIGYVVPLLFVAAILPLTWLRIFSLLGVVTLVAHVLAAAWSGTDFAADVRILARAPMYILWKITVLPSLLRNSQGNAAWVRTERVPATEFAEAVSATQAVSATNMEHVLSITSSLEIS
jgi:cellulose synthase/poly-beta-1,6-N-acetylglucosamine synthase-like glycosyltransferase